MWGDLGVRVSSLRVRQRLQIGRLGQRAVVQDGAILLCHLTVNGHEVALIQAPTVLKVFVVFHRRVVVTGNLYRGQYNNGQGVLTITLCRYGIQYLTVELRAVTISCSVLCNLRALLHRLLVCFVGYAVRDRCANVRCICFVCLLEYDLYRAPYCNVTRGLVARLVPRALQGLLTIIRPAVLVVI